MDLSKVVKAKSLGQNININRILKFIIIILLIIMSCWFSIYYHIVMKSCTVATHLFYIPIVVSAIWWRKKGLFIPLFFGLFLIASHKFYFHDDSPTADYLRIIMFFIVGATTIILRIQLSNTEVIMKMERKKLRYLTNRLANTEERHNMQIAAGLHDSVGPKLSAAKIMLHTQKSKVTQENALVFDKIIDCIDTSVAEIREMIFELSPKVLYELGLEPAIESLIQSYKKKTSLKFNYEFSGPSFNVNNYSRSIIFRAIRELLSNVNKHAMAQNVYIKIENKRETLNITIQDNGIGFNTTSTLMDDKYLDRFGLFSIRQQLLDINGYMFIKSNIGSGTKVTLTCPIKNKEEIIERKYNHDDKHTNSRRPYCNV